MSLFDIFRRKKTADDIIHEQAERVRKRLFPNGHADLELPGLKVKLIMGDRYTQQQCEAYYAAMQTWVAMMPSVAHERALRKFIDATGGKISSDEALELSAIIYRGDNQFYGINPGHVPEKAIELGTVIPEQRRERIRRALIEIFGEPDIGFTIERETLVTLKGRTMNGLILFSYAGGKATRHRIFFA